MYRDLTAEEIVQQEAEHIADTLEKAYATGSLVTSYDRPGTMSVEDCLQLWMFDHDRADLCVRMLRGQACIHEVIRAYAECWAPIDCEDAAEAANQQAFDAYTRQQEHDYAAGRV